ncbi:MAG: UrcA family protein [Steroidobacteraceae bacterium]
MKITQPGRAGHFGLAGLLAFATFAACAAEPPVNHVEKVVWREPGVSASGPAEAMTEDAGAHDGNVVRRSVAVHYLVLDANTKAGALRLYGRLKSAARRACGTASGRGLAAIRDFNRCRADALSAAVVDVGSRTLAAVHRSRASPLALARFDGVPMSR